MRPASPGPSHPKVTHTPKLPLKEPLSQLAWIREHLVCNLRQVTSPPCARFSTCKMGQQDPPHGVTVKCPRQSLPVKCTAQGLAEKLLEEGQLPCITVKLPNPDACRAGRAGRKQKRGGGRQDRGQSDSVCHTKSSRTQAHWSRIHGHLPRRPRLASWQEAGVTSALPRSPCPCG